MNPRESDCMSMLPRDYAVNRWWGSRGSNRPLDGFRVLDLTMFTEKVKLGALAGCSTNGH